MFSFCSSSLFSERAADWRCAVSRGSDRVRMQRSRTGWCRLCARSGRSWRRSSSRRARRGSCRVSWTTTEEVRRLCQDDIGGICFDFEAYTVYHCRRRVGNEWLIQPRAYQCGPAESSRRQLEAFPALEKRASGIECLDLPKEAVPPASKIHRSTTRRRLARADA